MSTRVRKNTGIRGPQDTFFVDVILPVYIFAHSPGGAQQEKKRQAGRRLMRFQNRHRQAVLIFVWWILDPIRMLFGIIGVPCVIKAYGKEGPGSRAYI